MNMKLLPITSLTGTNKRAEDPYSPYLMQSMYAKGQILPILVRKVKRTGCFWFMKTQMYEILDGFRRVDAARRLNWKVIAAQIAEITDAQMLEASIIASTPYVKTNRAQYRAALRRIQVMHPEMTRDELAARIGWTREKLDKELDHEA